MKNERAIEIGEHIDRLISTDFHTRRFILNLYDEARRVMDSTSLTYKAGSDLNRKVSSGDTVVIIFGFPTYGTYVAEQDGPIGAAILGRTIAELRSARVIAMTDKAQKNMSASAFRAAGFSILDKVRDIQNNTQTSVMGIEEGKEIDASKFMDDMNPSAVISIERPSRNREGKYMSMRGLDLSYKIARLDELIDVARERGILTVGVGDGGNETGCGLIHDAVVKNHPNGKIIASDVKTDDLVFASASNLGAYGIAGMLALLNEDLYALPERRILARTLKRSAEVGLHNGPPLWLDPGTDGIPSELEVFMLESIRRMIWEEINPHFPKFY